MVVYHARRRKNAEPCNFDVRYVCGRPRVVSTADRIAIVSSMRRFDAPSAPSPEYSNQRQRSCRDHGVVSAWVDEQEIATGLLTIFCRHTSASLLIQDNADPDVRTDLESFFDEIAPEDGKRYVHRTEGLDDMPAHIRTALSQTQLAVPINRGTSLIDFSRNRVIDKIGMSYSPALQ
jgi:secondary thiamine-phosphate synthase enzyme